MATASNQASIGDVSSSDTTYVPSEGSSAAVAPTTSVEKSQTSLPTTMAPPAPKVRPSLTQMLKDHVEQMERQRKTTEQKRKDVLESVKKVSDSMVDGVNRGVVRVFTNQQKIEKETKILESNAARFSKQASQWNTMVADLGNALKEIGDVENWASVIESDLMEVSLALEYIQGGSASKP